MGEYISREAVIKEMSHMMSECFPEAVEELDAVITTVKEIPTADVMEMRHERWDLAKDPFGAGYVKCSRCGYKHCPKYYPDGSAIMHLFCPSCGSVMDGGQDD